MKNEIRSRHSEALALAFDVDSDLFFSFGSSLREFCLQGCFACTSCTV